MELTQQSMIKEQMLAVKGSSAVLGDVGVPRIREVRDTEKCTVGRLHCTAKILIAKTLNLLVMGKSCCQALLVAHSDIFFLFQP